MTKDLDKFLDDDTARERVDSMRVRATELGFELAKPHAYELLATANGYRNWPGMKSALMPTGSGPSLKVGTVVPGDPLEFLLGDRKLGLPFSKLPGHVEVLAARGAPRRDFMAGVTISAIRERIGSCTIGHLKHEHIAAIREAAKESEAPLAVIDLNYHRRGPEELVDMFAEFNEGEMAALFREMTEDLGREKPERWRNSAFGKFADVLAALLVWLRDNRGLLVDILTIPDHFGMNTLRQFAFEGRESLPVELVATLKDYIVGTVYLEMQAEDVLRIETGIAEEHEFVIRRMKETLTTQYGLSAIPNHAKTTCVNLYETVRTSGNVVVVVPEIVGTRPGQQAVLNGLLRIVHRALRGRPYHPVLSVVLVDNASRYGFVGWQDYLEQATVENQGYILFSEAPLAVPAMKSAVTIHLVGERMDADFQRATMLTPFEATEFTYRPIEQRD